MTIEDKKLTRPKLTLSKSISSAGLLEKLKALAVHANASSSKNDNKQHTSNKIGATKNQQIQDKSKLQNQDLLNKGDNNATSVKLEYKKDKKKDKTAVKDQTENKIKEEKHQQQNKQNTHRKNKKKEEALKAAKTISFKGVLSRLRQMYPITFPGDETKIVALKVGINKDIKDNIELMSKLGISITYLGKFLKWYTSSKNYRTTTQVEGNARYNLQGDIEGKITKEQAEDIKKRLEHITNNKTNT